MYDDCINVKVCEHTIKMKILNKKESIKCGNYWKYYQCGEHTCHDTFDPLAVLAGGGTQLPGLLLRARDDTVLLDIFFIAAYNQWK